MTSNEEKYLYAITLRSRLFRSNSKIKEIIKGLEERKVIDWCTKRLSVLGNTYIKNEDERKIVLCFQPFSESSKILVLIPKRLFSNCFDEYVDFFYHCINQIIWITGGKEKEDAYLMSLGTKEEEKKEKDLMDFILNCFSECAG